MNTTKGSRTIFLILLAVAVVVFVYFFYFGTKPVVNEQSNIARASYVNNKGEKWEIPKDKLDFKISSAERYPKIVVGFINPLDVKVGDVQDMMIAVNSDTPVSRVWAEVETDNSVKTVELNLVGTSTVSMSDIMKQPYLVDAEGYLVVNDGKNPLAENLVKIAEAKAPIIQYRFEGNWVVEDTHTRTYHTKFSVEDSAKRNDSLILAWSDPTCIFDINGYLQTASCTPVSGEVIGFDGADVNLNSYTVLLTNSGSILAYNGGASGGINIGTGKIGTSVNPISGGAVKQLYMYYADGDGDTYVTSTQVYSNTASSWSGFVRLNNVGGRGSQTAYQVPITGKLDCNDTRSAAYPGSTGYGPGTTGWSAGFNAGDYNCNGSVGDIGGTSQYSSTNSDNATLSTYYENNGGCIVFLHGSCGQRFDSASYPGGVYIDNTCDQSQASIWENCQ